MNIGTAARLADIYAQSLLDLAGQSQGVEAVTADLDTLAALVAQNPDFQSFLASPYFTEQTKRELVGRVFAGKLHRLTLNFLSVMIDHGRGGLLPEIMDRFKQLHRAHQGYRTVKVTVAQTMSREQTEQLARDVAAALNARIDLDVHVDPSIVGGVIIRYGEKLLDNSVRGRLTHLVNGMTSPDRLHNR
jgi:F-type H+-transporting ATPase subunit delta